MASSTRLFPHLTPHRPTRNPFRRPNTSLHNHLSTTHHHHHQPHKRSPSVRASASSVAPLPINVDYLEREFSGHGVHFQSIGDSCVVKMGLDNGSAASLMLPSGLITSYKPIMWHGATTEVLHTTVSEGQNGEAVIRGGVSMDLTCASSDAGLSWSSNNSWALRNVRGSSNKSIQVELVSVGPNDNVQVNCVVTLQEDLLGSELTVTNLRSSSSLELRGSIISNLTVSTPDATYAIGLQGSTYHNMQPIASEFNIIPPGTREEKSSLHPLAQKGFDALFSGWDRKSQIRDEEWEEEGEEDDDYAQMTEKMSRIYTCAPREFSILDRGKRNSVVVRRSGFDEFYVSSPGSSYEWYGKYAYVCVGPSALLKPVVLGPESSWTGAQYLYNPNL